MSGSQNVYEGVLFEGKEGDLTTSKQGLSFQDYEDEKVTRFKWSLVQKHVTTKAGAPKAMIRISMVKQQKSKTVTFQMPDYIQLEALRDDIDAHTQKNPTPVPAPAAAPVPVPTPVPTTEVDDKTKQASSDDVEEANTNDADTPEIQQENLKNTTQGSTVPAVGQNMALVPVTTGFAKSAEPMEVVHSQDELQEQALVEKKPSVVASAVSTESRANGDIYGTSKYLAPMENPQFITEAEFEDFAPCACICYKCFIHDKIRKRTFVRAYENRIESNVPYNPFCCLGDERCMVDNVRVYYFDKAPHRVGMCCFFIPCVCCGPPVIFAKVPKACCALIDMRPCLGEQILHSNCDCFGMRLCLCCGPQCYQCCALPLFNTPFKNGDAFLAKWKGALDNYQDRNGLPKDQRAKFFRVEDRCCDTDSGTPIEAITMER